jgi:hypothetical protein
VCFTGIEPDEAVAVVRGAHLNLPALYLDALGPKPLWHRQAGYLLDQLMLLLLVPPVLQQVALGAARQVLALLAVQRLVVEDPLDLAGNGLLGWVV